MQDMHVVVCAGHDSRCECWLTVRHTSIILCVWVHNGPSNAYDDPKNTHAHVHKLCVEWGRRRNKPEFLEERASAVPSAAGRLGLDIQTNIAVWRSAKPLLGTCAHGET